MAESGNVDRAASLLAGVDLAPVVWNSGSLIVLITDRQGLLLEANPTFQDLAERDPRGEPLVTFVSEGQAQAFSQWLADINGPVWTARQWGILPGTDLLPRDIRLAGCLGSHDTRVLVGATLAVDDLASGLLDMNETLLEEQRRLAREGQRLDRVAQQDALSGVANRRAFDDRLALETRRTGAGGSFALVMLDIDHFKVLNDRYGHPTGDDALRWLGGLLLAATRGSDFVARYGGEEFAAILPDADAAGATRWAERLRRAVRGGLAPGVDMSVTISLGVAACRPGEDASDMLARADRALYVAKRTGRDRVVTDGVDPPSVGEDTIEDPSPVWNSSAIGAAIVDGTVVRRANTVLERLIGRRPDGLPIAVLVHPDQAQAFADHIQAAGPQWLRATFGFDADARGVLIDHVTWVRRRGGIVELFVEPAKAERGAVEATLLTLVDDLVEVQRTLERRTRALERELAERSPAYASRAQA